MNTKHEPFNRRQFIKSVSLSAAIVALSPNFTFGNLNQKLSISFSNTSLQTILDIKKVFLQSDDFIISKSSINADIHYVHTGELDNLEKFELANQSNTILIINQQNFEPDTLVYLKELCNKNKTFLLMIDESQQKSVQYLFSKATLYEPRLCNTAQINTIMKSIAFLNQLTMPNLFFTKNQLLA